MLVFWKYDTNRDFGDGGILSEQHLGPASLLQEPNGMENDESVDALCREVILLSLGSNFGARERALDFQFQTNAAKK